MRKGVTLVDVMPRGKNHELRPVHSYSSNLAEEFDESSALQKFGEIVLEHDNAQV
jgi:hypothetical protein